MALKRVDWVDEDGRMFASYLPEGVSESQASIGIPIGPPSLESLGLPLELEVRLNNALFMRGILEKKDVNNDEIRYALLAALKLDTQTIAALYDGKGLPYT